jgi:hypothetical protein
MTNNNKRIPYCDRKTETWSIGTMFPPTGLGVALGVGLGEGVGMPLSVGPALMFRPSTFLFKIFPANHLMLTLYKTLDDTIARS